MSTVDRPTTPAGQRLSAWERGALVALLAVVVLFGAVVELRSAFLKRRMGDFSVFARTAWAVRSGEDIYAVADANGFHYHYPPLFAILLTPLADPPTPGPRALPYAVSVGAWYVLSLFFLAFGVHQLASALEQTSSDSETRWVLRGSRRWWALRVLPILACLPDVGASLVRGQVDALLLLLLCGMIAAALRGRSFRAGVWLASAITLKVIPAYLLLYPLWRRDGRWLAGCAAGLAVFLGVIPAAVFGPGRTVAYYREWKDVLLQPALTEGGDQTRANELTNVTATDSQSFLAILHNALHPDRVTRPANATPAVRLTHWGLGGVLTLLTPWAAGWRREEGPRKAVFIGSLVILMLLLSPVCHLHYFVLALLPMTGLLAATWETPGRPEAPLLSRGAKLLLLAYAVAHTLPRLPGLQPLRDSGLAMQAAVVVWAFGCVVLRKRSRCKPAQEIEPADVPMAA